MLLDILLREPPSGQQKDCRTKTSVMRMATALALRNAAVTCTRPEIQLRLMRCNADAFLMQGISGSSNFQQHLYKLISPTWLSLAVVNDEVIRYCAMYKRVSPRFINALRGIDKLLIKLTAHDTALQALALLEFKNLLADLEAGL